MTQPSVIGGKGSIPATSDYEYRAESSTDWINATGTVTLDPGRYLFRVRANGTVLASEAQEITLTEFVSGKEQTPSARFTATGDSTGVLSEVTAGMKYKIGNGEWIDITASNGITLTGLSPTTISVQKSGNGTTTVDSDIQTITVTKATVTTVTVTPPGTADNPGDKHRVSIDGFVASAYEYKAGTATEWTTVTENNFVTDPGTYSIRVKASGTVLASAVSEFVVSEPPAIVYNVLSGATGTWRSGSEGGMTVRVDGDHSKFQGIEVNGVPVGRNNFTDNDGSTIVTLSAAYLAGLPDGDYTLRVLFTDGYAETVFTVTGNDKNSAPSLLWLWITLPCVVVAGGGTAIYFIFIRKKRGEAADK